MHMLTVRWCFVGCFSLFVLFVCVSGRTGRINVRMAKIALMALSTAPLEEKYDCECVQLQHRRDWADAWLALSQLSIIGTHGFIINSHDWMLLLLIEYECVMFDACASLRHVHPGCNAKEKDYCQSAFNLHQGHYLGKNASAATSL